MIFYIADTHFGHENAIRYDERPFADTREMAEGLIERWNRRVGEEDTVYVLGDAFWKAGEDNINIFKRLNGHKRLIRGNHDRVNGTLGTLWESVESYAEIVDGGTQVILCHYPILFYKNQHHGAVMLYGHVHSTVEWRLIEKWRRELRELGIPDKIINVGCMMTFMDYAPRTLAELLAAGAGGVGEREEKH